MYLGGIHFKIFCISHLIINILVTKPECPGCWCWSWEGFQEEVGEGWVRNARMHGEGVGRKGRKTEKGTREKRKVG